MRALSSASRAIRATFACSGAIILSAVMARCEAMKREWMALLPSWGSYFVSPHSGASSSGRRPRSTITPAGTEADGLVSVSIEEGKVQVCRGRELERAYVRAKEGNNVDAVEVGEVRCVREGWEPGGRLV